MHKTIFNDFLPEAVVLDAGSFPSHAVPLQILASTPNIVCCDGAAAGYIGRGYTPWRIVGDCDSLNPALQREYSNILRRNPDQETNDQTKAVTYLAKHGFQKIAIVGATGMREDHTLGNISLLIDYMTAGMDVRIYSDYGVFIPYCDSAKIELPQGTRLSIFNFSATGFSASGLEYPLHEFTSWWQGTLNRSTDREVKIHAHGYWLLFAVYPSSE